MTAPVLSQNPQMIPYFYVLARLMLKASSAKTKEELIFLIVNDSIHLLPYNRAVLFHLEEKGPKVIGISGQASINDSAPLVKTLEDLVSLLKDPKEMSGLAQDSFSQADDWNAYQKQSPSAVLWVPIFSKQELVLGLWLEQMEATSFGLPLPEMPMLLKGFLTHAYGIAWERIFSKFSVKNKLSSVGKKRLWFLLPLLALCAFIPVPLRIAAPCEIISSSPYVIRAPLNGVIKELLVHPGQMVKKEDPLLVYDTAVPLHTLQSAREDVNEKKLDFERASLLGMQNKQPLTDLNLLQIKLEKEKINLALAYHEANLLTVRSPQEGIVILDSADEWRGHPVLIGEKIMVISDPVHTKIKIWIPESDNVPLDPAKAVKIYLNIFPTESYKGQIEYIANEVTLSDREVPSYVAKANWLDAPPKDLKLGLKGTAILYGENVPLFYYLIRKPWFTLRNFLGV